MIELRRFRAGDRDAVFRFVRYHFPARDPQVERRVWEWRYERNPFETAGPCVLLALRDGEIVGQIATMAVPVVVDGRRFRGRWAVDLLVDPSTRGTGLGRQLIQAWVDESEVCLGKGVSESADRIYRKMGWQHVPLLPVRIAVTSARAFVGRRTRNPVIAAIADRSTRWLGGLRMRVLGRASLGLRFQTEARVPDRFDELAAVLARRVRVALVRDREYLQWRYKDCPTTSYRLDSVWRDDSLVGFVVVSVMPTRGFRRGVVHDLQIAIEETGAYDEVLRHASLALHRMGADEITVLPRNADEVRSLRRLGTVTRDSPMMILYDNTGRSLDLANASTSMDIQLGDSDGW